MTAHAAVLPPARAVMFASPALTAVTVPSSPTVATSVSDDDHVTVLSSAFSGSTVAVRFPVVPRMSVSVVSLRVTLSTATGSGSLLPLSQPVASSAIIAAMQAASHVVLFIYFSLSVCADVFVSCRSCSSLNRPILPA